MLEFRSAIVDELGHIIAWCSEFTESEINQILETYTEYRIECIQIG